MIPENKFSSEPVYSPFRAPDGIERPSYLVDYELGGRDLNDSSEGLEVHTWIAEYNPATGDVSVFAPGVPQTTVFTALGLTELSLAFDQNMRPVVAFVQNGQAKFFWYDTVLGATRINDLPAGSFSPRCCMDDKRDMQTSQGQNDVIIAYLRGTSLYFRQQRDRYENEYLLTASIPGRRLVCVGMNQGRRLQFEFE